MKKLAKVLRYNINIFSFHIIVLFSIMAFAMNDATYNMKDVYLNVKDHRDLVDVIPDEMATSYPVPLLVEENGDSILRIIFFHYYMTRNSSKGVGVSSISSPRQQTLVKYPELSIIETKPVTSKSFKIDWDDSKPVGEYVADPAISYDQIVKQRNRFFELYDVVLPLYIAKSVSLTEGEKDNIKEFNILFGEVGFPSLMPYYKALNPDFFSWLNKNAQ